MTHAALPTLRTPRLTLRPLEENDADAITEGIGNYDVSKWLSVVPYPYTRDDALWFIGKCRDGGTLTWAIVDDAGLQGIVGIDEGLGYWLARPAWGKGYGFEAAGAVVAHWFSDPSNTDMTTLYFEGNDRSANVLRALGFVPTGQRKRYARALSQEVTATDVLLTRAEWQRRQDFTLYTPRLTLRPVTLDDATAFAALTTPEVARNLGNVPANMSVQDAAADIPRRMWRGVPGFTLLIEREGAVVGWVGFGGKTLSIGYALHSDHWGQGVMTEALSAFLPELFVRFPVSRIVADHFVDNPASGRILEKLGFEKTGEEMGTSKARLEPARLITYAVTRETFKVPV